MCQDYFGDIFWSKITGQSIAFIIVGVNLALKAIIIALVEWVGEETLSEQKSSITRGVLFAQFFNTSILILLVNANLSEHEPKVVTQFFHGPFSDYVPSWYLEVGTKVLQTMIINSFMPLVALGTTYFVPFFS